MTDEQFKHAYEAGITIVRLTAERDAAIARAEESEHAMHMRVRGEYDSTIRETWEKHEAQAVEAEREACAKVCEVFVHAEQGFSAAAAMQCCANAIRARKP